MCYSSSGLVCNFIRCIIVYPASKYIYWNRIPQPIQHVVDRSRTYNVFKDLSLDRTPNATQDPPPPQYANNIHPQLATDASDKDAHPSSSQPIPAQICITLCDMDDDRTYTPSTQESLGEREINIRNKTRWLPLYPEYDALLKRSVVGVNIFQTYAADAIHRIPYKKQFVFRKMHKRNVLCGLLCFLSVWAKCLHVWLHAIWLDLLTIKSVSEWICNRIRRCSFIPSSLLRFSVIYRRPLTNSRKKDVL